MMLLFGIFKIPAAGGYALNLFFGEVFPIGCRAQPGEGRSFCSLHPLPRSGSSSTRVEIVALDEHPNCWGHGFATIVSSKYQSLHVQ